MLGLTDYDLSLKWPHSMIFEMNPDYIVALALCAPEVKVKEFLFGKDVAKTPSKAKTMVDLEDQNIQEEGYTVIAIGRTGTPLPNHRGH